ncbi:MAG: sugar transferase [Ilumatobacter sp.]|uniref:sugar transferase n=1 Tax=Ilumatobacter sp. TaxID=1967498 RepID=UPI0032986127
MLADVAALVVGVALAFATQAIVRPVPTFVIVDHLWLAASSAPAFALGAGMSRLYHSRANERPLEEAVNIFKAVGTGMSWLLLVSLGVQYQELSRLWVALVGIGVTGCLLVERRIARSVFRRLRSDGRLRRRIVIVGTDEHAIALMHDYQRNPSLGYEVIGLAAVDGAPSCDEVEPLGTVDDLSRVLDDHDAVGVVVSLASVPSARVNTLTRRLTDEGYHVALSSSLRDIDVSRLRPQSMDGRTLIYVEPIIRNGWRGIAKRVFDLVLASAILLASLPLQLVAAAAIKSTSRGPIFFRQVRVGKDGELFEVVKYRTMVIDAEERKAELMSLNEADGPLFKMKSDPRVTPVGRILRKLSIDELPQLFCVLVGTMSMVGPRPALPEEVEQWDDEVSERLRALPGLTGMWQVSGRSDSSFETYKRMDLYYVDNWSLFHDLQICSRTVAVVLRGRGAA